LLTIEDGEFLVRFARETAFKFLKGEAIETPSKWLEKPSRRSGVFVAVRQPERDVKRLISCSGYCLPNQDLIKGLVDSSINAIIRARSFLAPKSIKPDSVIFEASVLTIPKPVRVSKPTDLPRKIKVGLDGLLVELNFYRGVLLPQIAVEQRWNETEFIAECCMNAGLPADIWLEGTASIYSFQADVFQELLPFGDVTRIMSSSEEDSTLH